MKNTVIKFDTTHRVNGFKDETIYYKGKDSEKVQVIPGGVVIPYSVEFYYTSHEVNSNDDVELVVDFYQNGKRHSLFHYKGNENDPATNEAINKKDASIPDNIECLPAFVSWYYV